jgi:hypothetical protein
VRVSVLVVELLLSCLEDEDVAVVMEKRGAYA